MSTDDDPRFELHLDNDFELDLDNDSPGVDLPSTSELVLCFVVFSACFALADGWAWLKHRLGRFFRSEWAVYAATVVLAIVGSAVHPGPVFGG